MENAMAVNGSFHLTTPSKPKQHSHAIWLNFKVHLTDFHYKLFASVAISLSFPDTYKAIVNPYTVISFNLSKSLDIFGVKLL